MRRAWLSFLMVPLLAACGTVATPPSPSAGTLLGAPTALQVSGRSVRAEATPVLDRGTFRVQVRVQTTRPPLPPLTVTGVYVVTEDGVWRAAQTRSERPTGCEARVCLQGTGQGSAQGLRSGEGVQVVVSLRSAGGRTMWLRDARASIVQR